MSARSDQTLVCVACKLRFARLAGACPGCGEAGEELGDVPARLRLTTALRKSSPLSPAPIKRLLDGWLWLGGVIGKWSNRAFSPGKKQALWKGWLVPGALMGVPAAALAFKEGFSLGRLAISPVLFAIGMMMGTVLAMALCFSALAMAMIAVYLPLLLLLALLRLVEWLAWDRARVRRPRPFALALAEPPAPAAGEAVRGRVRCAAPIDSPLGPCAAWRLRGDGESGPIDDAAVAGFEVVGERDEVVADFAGNATVELDASEPAAPPLALADAVSLAGGQPVSLRAGALRDGDEVELSGASETSAVAGGGYRDARFLRRFAEKPGEPVVIRRMAR